MLCLGIYPLNGQNAFDKKKSQPIACWGGMRVESVIGMLSVVIQLKFKIANDEGTQLC